MSDEEKKEYDRDEYNKGYYSKNRDDILARKREKYARDTGYRERIRESSRKYREESRKDRGQAMVQTQSGPVVAVLVPELAERIGKSISTVNYWQKYKVLPKTPFKDYRGRRLYTSRMVDIIIQVMDIYPRPAKGQPEFFEGVRVGWAGIGIDAVDESV